VIVVSATVAVISPLTRTLCAAATILHTSAPPTRPPPTPAGAAAMGKGAHKMILLAKSLPGLCPHVEQGDDGASSRVQNDFANNIIRCAVAHGPCAVRRTDPALIRPNRPLSPLPMPTPRSSPAPSPR
jgi:hypothetical protein